MKLSAIVGLGVYYIITFCIGAFYQKATICPHLISSQVSEYRPNNKAVIGF